MKMIAKNGLTLIAANKTYKPQLEKLLDILGLVWRNHPKYDNLILVNYNNLNKLQELRWLVHETYWKGYEAKETELVKS